MLFNPLFIGTQNNQTTPEAGNDLKNKVRGLGVMFGDLMTKSASEMTGVDSGVLNSDIKSVLTNPEVLSGIQLVIDNPEKLDSTSLLAKLANSDSNTSIKEILESLKLNPNIKLTEIPDVALNNPVKLESLLKANSVENLPGLILKATAGNEVKTYLVTPTNNGIKTNLPALLQQIIPVKNLVPVEAEVIAAKISTTGEITVTTDAIGNSEPASVMILDAKKLLTELKKVEPDGSSRINLNTKTPSTDEVSSNKLIVKEIISNGGEESSEIATNPEFPSAKPLYAKLKNRDKEISKIADIIVTHAVADANVSVADKSSANANALVTDKSTADAASVKVIENAVVDADKSEHKIISAEISASTATEKQADTQTTSVEIEEINITDKVTAGKAESVEKSAEQIISNGNDASFREDGEKITPANTGSSPKEVVSPSEKQVSDNNTIFVDSGEKKNVLKSADVSQIVKKSDTEIKSGNIEGFTVNNSSETAKATVVLNHENPVYKSDVKEVANPAGDVVIKAVTKKSDVSSGKVNEQTIQTEDSTQDEKTAKLKTSDSPTSEIKPDSSAHKGNAQSENSEIVKPAIYKTVPESASEIKVNPVQKKTSDSVSAKISQNQQVNTENIKTVKGESNQPNLANNPDFEKTDNTVTAKQTVAKDPLSHDTPTNPKPEPQPKVTESVSADGKIKFVAAAEKVIGSQPANKNQQIVDTNNSIADSAKVETKTEAAGEIKTVEVESLSVGKKTFSNDTAQVSAKNIPANDRPKSGNNIKLDDNVKTANESAKTTLTNSKIEGTPQNNELNKVKTGSPENPIADTKNSEEKLSATKNFVSANNSTSAKAAVSESVKQTPTPSVTKPEGEIETTSPKLTNVDKNSSDSSGTMSTKTVDTYKSKSERPKDSIPLPNSEIKRTQVVNSPKIDIVSDTSKINIEYESDSFEVAKEKSGSKVTNPVKPGLPPTEVIDGKKVTTGVSENNIQIKAAKFAENINNRVRSVKSLLNTITNEKTDTTPQLRVKAGTEQNVRSVIEQLNFSDKPKVETKGILEQLQAFAKKPEISVSGAQKTANEHFRNRILAGPLQNTSDIKSNLRNINQYSNIDKIFVSDKESSYTKFVEGSKSQFWSVTNRSVTDNGKNLNESLKTVNITGNNEKYNTNQVNEEKPLHNDIKDKAENKVIITSSSLKSNLKASDGTELVHDIKKMLNSSSETKVEITYKPNSNNSEPAIANSETPNTEMKHHHSAKLNFREREFMNAERVQQVEREIENIKVEDKPVNHSAPKPKIDVEVKELFNLLEKSSDKTLLSQLKRMTGKYLEGKFEIKLVDDQPEASANKNTSFNFQTADNTGKVTVDRVTGYFDQSNNFGDKESANYSGSNNESQKDNHQQKASFRHSSDENKVEFRESFRFDGPGIRNNEDKPNPRPVTINRENIPVENQDSSTNSGMSTSEHNTAFFNDGNDNFENVKDFYNINENKVVSETFKTSSIFAADDPVKHVRAKNLMQEISKFFEQKYNNSITFKITPEHLGKVKVSLKLVNDVLKASIEVENDQVKQLVENNMSTLKSTLMMNGLTSGDINVMVSNQSSKHSKYFPNQKKRDKSFADEKESLEAAHLDESTLINRRNYGYNTYEFTA